MLTGREWRQNFNVDGLLYFVGNIWRLPSLLRPRLVVKDISSLSLATLRDDLKLKGIVFDKDNCLTIPYEDNIDPRVEERVKEIAQNFECIIVSNGTGGPDDLSNEIREISGIAILQHFRKKPACGEDIKQYFVGMSIKPSEIGIIGDRLLTDIFMANHEGMVGIFTQPLDTGKDPISVKMLRYVEALFLKLLNKV